MCTGCCHLLSIIKINQYTVVPLLKDTLAKGHLSNKDRIIWHQVLWLSLILPLTKGHLSNEDRIIWQKGGGVLIRGGPLYYASLKLLKATCHNNHGPLRHLVKVTWYLPPHTCWCLVYLQFFSWCLSYILFSCCQCINNNQQSIFLPICQFPIPRPFCIC